jgi:hypothetical protein
MGQLEQALNWVRNARGGATVESLRDDYAPIGDQLLDDMLKYEFVEVDADQFITLTAAGELRLKRGAQ